MKAAKIRQLDSKELAAQEAEIAEQLFRLRMQLGIGQAEGLKKYWALKKDRARLLTVMREKQIAAGRGEGN